MTVASVVVKFFVLICLLGGVGFALIVWLNRKEAEVTDHRYDKNFNPRQGLRHWQHSLEKELSQQLDVSTEKETHPTDNIPPAKEIHKKLVPEGIDAENV